MPGNEVLDGRSTSPDDALAPRRSRPTERRDPRRAAPQAGTGARAVVQLAVLVVPVIAFAFLAWNHRWMTDDGFINLRVVRQLQAGNGPVFNGGERVEAYTSVLWIAVLALGDLALPLQLEWVAVALGLVGSTAGLALATVGSLRLQGKRPEGSFLVPLGAMAVAALYPMWFFASGGLEGGLVFAWLGGCLLLLGNWARHSSHRVSWWGAAILGLGWLIRPELAVVSALLLGAVLVGEWTDTSWADRCRLAAFGLGLPFIYEVFRMGYFGALVPNTAFAKQADRAEYGRGLHYLGDTVGTYALWLPGAALLVSGYGPLLRRGVARRFSFERRTLVGAAFGLGGVLTAAYVVRVGGDYIAARLLLPSLFAICAPVAVVVVERRIMSIAAVVIVVPWAACNAALSNHPVYQASLDGRSTNLVTAEQLAGPLDRAYDWYRGGHDIYWETRRLPYAPGPAVRRPTVARLGIGVTGYVLGPKVDIYDELGLGDPITSRFRVRSGAGIPGHEKPAPPQWSAARLTAPGERPQAVDLQAVLVFKAIPQLLAPVDDARFQAQVGTVRRVLRCRPMRQLRDATAGRMTVGRFLQNLRWSIHSYSLEIPPDPDEASRELCRDG